MRRSFVQLYDLANRNGTDKGHIGPSARWSANNYTDIYQAYFGRDRESIRHFCEVGLGVPGPNWESSIAQGTNPRGGGSMRRWHDFFPNATLYGLDINPADHLENDRVKTYEVDQSSTDSLESFKEAVGDVQFDIIIDDGSHISDHQQLTLSLLWDKLASGGMYVIEDLNSVGLGDTRHGKHAPRNAESTRTLFQHYIAAGEVLPQNGFVNLEFLKEVDYIALHGFPVIQRPRDIAREIIRNLVGRGGKGLLRHEFQTSAPKIVVIRKK